MAELASNKGWLDKVDQVGNAAYVHQLILYVRERYKSTFKQMPQLSIFSFRFIDSSLLCCFYKSVDISSSLCLFRVQQGQALMESKPEFEPIVKERLAKLHELWEKLESTTQEKARLLFDANRSELFDQSLKDMKKWLGGLQQQLQSGDEDVKDLTNANILLKKHQVCPFVACTVYTQICTLVVSATPSDAHFLNHM